jgi:hypothetical protein
MHLMRFNNRPAIPSKPAGLIGNTVNRYFSIPNPSCSLLNIRRVLITRKLVWITSTVHLFIGFTVLRFCKSEILIKTPINSSEPQNIYPTKPGRGGTFTRPAKGWAGKNRRTDEVGPIQRYG